jgi:hypothetical protein
MIPSSMATVLAWDRYKDRAAPASNTALFALDASVRSEWQSRAEEGRVSKRDSRGGSEVFMHIASHEEERAEAGTGDG